MENYEDKGEVIFRLFDGVWIPKDPENKDYQQFLIDTNQIGE